MKMLPSLKQLEYLSALAETEHFGRASELCSVTPSTLSAGIRDLESVLGEALAERTKRRVLMTPFGRRVAARAQLLLRDAEDIMELAATQHGFMVGAMNLGVIPTISPFLLPSVLPALTARYPDLQLYLREEKTEQLLAKLRTGDIDVALIALPFETDGLATQVLFEDRFQFACHKDHPYVGRKAIANDDLAREPLLLLEEGHCLRGHALDACLLHAGKFRGRFEATSLPTLVQMVAAGIGVTLLPELAIKAQIAAGTDIELVPITGAASRQIGLVWRQTSPRSEEFGALGQVFKAVYEG